jgi:hypothetical protein
MDDTKPTRRVSVQLPDPMRYFSREGPVVKLLALLICKLPALFAAAGTAFLVGAKAFGWW